MSSGFVLETFHLGKRFNGRWAVRDINLQVQRGEIFGFLGPNGAGKSTTIRMLLTLMSPSTGRIEIFGKSVFRDRRAVLSRVGGLVESPDFYLYLSARKNLEIVAALSGNATKRDIDRVLEIVGLSSRAGDKVKTFSHGMKQRLGIAQALLGSPDFIVLDEPTSGLDPQGIKEVRELIRQLCTELSMTIFLSSHLLGEIEQTATSMAIINEGVLVVQGKVRELLNTGDCVVLVESVPIQKSIEIIRRLSYVRELTIVGERIQVNMPLERTGALNSFLVHGGVEVKSLIPKRSLEEYFLSITENAPNVK